MGRKGKKKFISQEYSAEKGGKNLQEGTKRSRGATIFAASFFSVAIIIGICLVSFTVVFFYSEVKGTSMMLAINHTGGDTDSVIVNRYKKPRQGDVIVVNHYDHNGKFKELHIKRLMSIGGGESQAIHFRLIDASGNTITNVYQRYLGVRYVIEIGGVELDNNHEKFLDLNGDNQASVFNTYHNDFWLYQQTGIIQDSMKASYARRILNNNPAFRTTYKDASGADVSFLRTVNRDGEVRNEFVLPSNYIFYMGDNRGGDGSNTEFNVDGMSADCSYFGPQPRSNLVGVVTEVIPHTSAPKWFWDKIVWIITFRWV